MRVIISKPQNLSCWVSVWLFIQILGLFGIWMELLPWKRLLCRCLHCQLRLLWKQLQRAQAAAQPRGCLNKIGWRNFPESYPTQILRAKLEQLECVEEKGCFGKQDHLVFNIKGSFSNSFAWTSSACQYTRAPLKVKGQCGLGSLPPWKVWSTRSISC